MHDRLGYVGLVDEPEPIRRDEFEALRRAVADQLRRIEQLHGEAAVWKEQALAERRERERVEARLAETLRRLYGRKAERFDPNQVELFQPGEPAPAPAVEEPTVGDDDPPEPRRRARPHGRGGVPRGASPRARRLRR